MASSADDAVLVLLDEVRSDLEKQVKGVVKTMTEQHTAVVGGLKVAIDAINGPALQGTLHEVQARLDTPPDTALHDRIVDLVDRLHQLRPPRVRPWWMWPASVVLAVGLGIGGTWWMLGYSTASRWAVVGSRVDKVLVEQYLGLSKPAQDALNSVYQQLGIPSPGERKGRRS